MPQNPAFSLRKEEKRQLSRFACEHLPAAPWKVSLSYRLRIINNNHSGMQIILLKSPERFFTCTNGFLRICKVAPNKPPKRFKKNMKNKHIHVHPTWEKDEDFRQRKHMLKLRNVYVNFAHLERNLNVIGT